MQQSTGPRTPAGSPRAGVRLLAATLVAVLALGLYAGTLLPGQDLGDTASFQEGAGERVLTARQGYPLYFAITGLFVHAMPGNPAGAANLASAVEAALAAGVLVLVGAEVSGALVGGLVAGLLLAGAYTYWSQAVIAEVYALHALLTGLSLLALLGWRRAPSTGRLAVFFAAYALGFGNHLQTVLLLPAFAVFLLVSAPGGARTLLRPRIVLMALGLAALFALQYAWNFATFYFEPNHPPFLELLQTFWFDVTKSDWRENMVVTVHPSMIGDRFAMYWFDLRQQVGVPGVVAAVAGLAFLFRVAWRLGLLLVTAWLCTWVFAFTYNVGDAHVFFLSSHYFVALAAGCGAALLWHATRWHLAKASPAGYAPAGPRWRATAAVLGVALLAYPAWRVWDTWPAMDRSDDRWPTVFFDRLTGGLDGRHEILARDLNWQLHNGLDYYARYTKPGLPVLDAAPSLLHFSFVVWANAAIGRDVVLTEGAARLVQAAYGDLLAVQRDPRLPVPTLADRVAGLRRGTPYVLSVLDSYRERPLDPQDLRATAARLGLNHALPTGRYVVVAGKVGEPPLLERAAMTPFRGGLVLDGRRVEVRMESWLRADTIRRMGFGHVIVDRRHVLMLDRGASFVALSADGTPQTVAWSGGMYTPQARYVIRHEAARP